MPKIFRAKLLKKIKNNGNWILVPALFDSKGRVRRDHVRVAGRDEVHPEGSYFIEWWEEGRRVKEAAGPDAFIAAEKKFTRLLLQQPEGRSTLMAAANFRAAARNSAAAFNFVQR